MRSWKAVSDLKVLPIIGCHNHALPFKRAKRWFLFRYYDKALCLAPVTVGRGWPVVLVARPVVVSGLGSLPDRSVARLPLVFPIGARL